MNKLKYTVLQRNIIAVCFILLFIPINLSATINYLSNEESNNNIVSKVYLPQNLKSGINIFTQAMIDSIYQNKEEHKHFVILYDYDLQGKVITIPPNCLLDFRGGSFRNGTFIGNKTKIQAYTKAFHLDLILAGTWFSETINSSCFGLKSDLILDKDYKYVSGTNNYQGFKNMMLFSDVYFTKGNYFIQGTISIENTNINGNYSIIKGLTDGSDYLYFPIFWIGNNAKKSINITIENLTLIGSKPDVKEKTETIHGFQIQHAHHITFKNVNSFLCKGDGFYIGTDYIVKETEWKLQYSAKDITLINCNADSNHRQGLSITKGEHILIDGCSFTNTIGTDPQCGIDIEPNLYRYSDGTFANITISNVIIKNCLFKANKNNGIYLYGMLIPRVSVHNIKIENCEFTENKNGIEFFNCNNIQITNCNFHKNKADGIYFANGENKNIYIDNCFFEGGTKANQNAIAFTKTNDSSKTIANVNISSSIVRGYNYPFLIDGTGVNIHHLNFKNILIRNCNGGFYIQPKEVYITFKDIKFLDEKIKPDGASYENYAIRYSIPQ